MDKITELTQWLQARKGQWPQIAVDSNVNYWFIQRLGQGRAANPSYSTINKLYEYMQSINNEEGAA